MEKFWCCYVNGTAGCRKRHETLAMACEEAERLARDNEGKDVYILESVHRCHTIRPTIEWDIGNM